MSALFNLAPTRDGIGTSGTEESDGGDFRFVLWRRIGPGSRVLLFVMLNPSTADHTEDDPTIRRCIGFARREAFDVVRVVNLFAYRATDPAELRMLIEIEGWGAPWPLHVWADAEREVRSADTVVVAWGATLDDRVVGPAAQPVIDDLLAWRSDLLCLGTTKSGHPKHPLYLAASTPLVPWSRP
jgi:hypothetical protein